MGILLQGLLGILVSAILLSYLARKPAPLRGQVLTSARPKSKRRRREPKRHPVTEPIVGWFYRTLALCKRWLPGNRGVKGLRLACIQDLGTACPSQWDGWLIDKRPIYIRYRFGNLMVMIGEVGENIECASISDYVPYYEKVCYQWDGWITLDEVRRLTGLLIDPSAILTGYYIVPFRLDDYGRSVTPVG